MRISCLICTELFDGQRDVSAAPCGHTFHAECLTSWFRQSPTCPQCRERITAKRIIKKLFFNQEEGDEDPSARANDIMGAQLQNTQLRLMEKKQELSETESKMACLQVEMAKLNEQLSASRSQCEQEKHAVKALKREVQMTRVMAKEGERAKQELIETRKELNTFTTLKKLVEDSQPDIEEMLSQRSDSRQMATWCTVLQKELNLKRNEGHKLSRELQNAKKESSLNRFNEKQRVEELLRAREQHDALESDLESCRKRIARQQKELQSCCCSSNSKKCKSSENEVKTLRINSTESADGRVVQSSSPQVLQVLPVPVFNKPQRADKTGKIRSGYNGMGGHSKLVVSSKKSFDLFKNIRESSSPYSNSAANVKKQPRLPSMSQFLN